MYIVATINYFHVEYILEESCLKDVEISKKEAEIEVWKKSLESLQRVKQKFQKLAPLEYVKGLKLITNYMHMYGYMNMYKCRMYWQECRTHMEGLNNFITKMIHVLC